MKGGDTGKHTKINSAREVVDEETVVPWKPEQRESEKSPGGSIQQCQIQPRPT